MVIDIADSVTVNIIRHFPKVRIFKRFGIVFLIGRGTIRCRIFVLQLNYVESSTCETFALLEQVRDFVDGCFKSGGM